MNLQELKKHKREQIIKHQDFIKELFYFMQVQKIVPVHPVYSQNQFMLEYVQGQLRIRLFEKSVPRKPQFKDNNLFSLRVDRDSDDLEYPLCYLEIETILDNTGDFQTNILLEKAMRNKNMVFVNDGWVEHFQSVIAKNRKEQDLKQENNEQSEINHYKKLLRI